MKKHFKKIKYGQNYLRNKELVHRLVNQSNIKEADTVLEIGPGRGIITRELLAKAGKVLAIEKDVNLYEYIKEEFGSNEKLEVVRDNFLYYDLRNLKDYKVFANIPFNITADVFRKLFLKGKNVPQSTYLILQKEAAIKYLAEPYGPTTQFSALMKPYVKGSIVYQFDNTDFDPVPSIDIVLALFSKREHPLVEKEDQVLYENFIVYSFNSFKKDLRKSWDFLFTDNQFKRLAKENKFALDAVPSDLKFEQWIAVFNYLLTGVDAKRKIELKSEAGLLKKKNSSLK